MNKTRKPSIQPKASIFGQIINLTINVFPFFCLFLGNDIQVVPVNYRGKAR